MIMLGLVYMPENKIVEVKVIYVVQTGKISPFKYHHIIIEICFDTSEDALSPTLPKHS